MRCRNCHRSLHSCDKFKDEAKRFDEINALIQRLKEVGRGNPWEIRRILEEFREASRLENEGKNQETYP